MRTCVRIKTTEKGGEKNMENQYNFDHNFLSLDCEESMNPDEIAAAEYDYYMAQKEAE